MTTSYYIDNALCKHLNLFTPSLDIVWENTNFTPTNGQPYLEVWLMPARTIPITLGPNCWEEYLGIFQVTCVYPAGFGRGAAKEKAAAIVSHFDRGTNCTYSDITVQIRQAYVGPSMYSEDGSWYRTPVSIEYWAFSNS